MINEPILNTETLMSIVASSKLSLVGGKGGVGKTTIAAALAADLARLKPKSEILLLSLDPSHSLSHLFQTDLIEAENNKGLTSGLYTKKKHLDGLANLGILELDFSALTEGFRTEYGSSIENLVEEGTLLNETDIEAFVDVSLPALGELMALMEITELLALGEVDHVIVDAAPTGHTVRLLDLPQFLRYLSEALTLMDERRSLIMSSLVGRSRSGNSREQVSDTLTARGEALKSLLKDANRSGVIVVSLAERLPLLETIDLMSDLKEKDVPIKAVVINKMATPGCLFCSRRYNSQQSYLAEADNEFLGTEKFGIPMFLDEPRTASGLSTMMNSLKPLQLAKFEIDRNTPLEINVTGKLTDYIASGFRLVVFAGKGGVGKTSLGAASALVLAKRHPDKRVLIASIDPAHSLGDSYGVTLSTTPVQVLNNLWGAEVNAKDLLADFKAIYAQEMNDFLTGLLPSANNDSDTGLKMSQDQEIAEKLINLETPDLDEFMVFRWLTRLKSEDHFDIVFLDPAPAGHLLRFLELPDIATHWIKASLKVINKHHAMEKTQRTVKELLSQSKAIATFKEELRRKNETTLVAVATPQEIVLAGMCDMLNQLDKYDVGMDTMVINMISPDSSSCNFCHKLHSAQREQINSAKHALDKLNLVTITQASTDIQGLSALKTVGEALYG